MISVHAYKTWQGETRVCIAHSAGSMPAENGMPGVRTTLLNEQEARGLLAGLVLALEAPPQCIDCGSLSHTVDSPSCPVSNKEENE